jgi:hypothetical protein
VFDGVGASTWQTSLKVLDYLGTLVSFGNASGKVRLLLWVMMLWLPVTKGKDKGPCASAVYEFQGGSLGRLFSCYTAWLARLRSCSHTSSTSHP